MGKRGQSPFIAQSRVIIRETGTVTVYFTFGETGTLLRQGYGRAQQSPFISLFCVVIMFDLRNRTLEPQDVTLGQKVRCNLAGLA